MRVGGRGTPSNLYFTGWSVVESWGPRSGRTPASTLGLTQALGMVPQVSIDPGRSNWNHFNAGGNALHEGIGCPLIGEARLEGDEVVIPVCSSITAEINGLDQAGRWRPQSANTDSDRLCTPVRPVAVAA
ncbi:hypothetical protein E2542_SST09490 [Spatholobus suberectus]|nr:hypothetical protein E2542_SST09490 [Spatholobus suberectus]